MATLEDTSLQIAGIGHVYYGEPDTVMPDLKTFTFGDGTTLNSSNWTWLGDTSAENLVEFEKDGGEQKAKRTWDRQNARSYVEESTKTVTINSVNAGKDTIDLAFPGSVKEEDSGSWGLDLDGSVEKAFLLVIEDGATVSALLIRRCSVSGSLPKLSLENFTEFELKAAILSPTSGKKPISYLPPTKRTGR